MAWMNTCLSCGAEEPLEALMLRIIDDDESRRAIHDVVTVSMPLGSLLLRYVRLHKPPKQKLRMARLRELLVELASDMRRNVIERHGREWPVTVDDWRGAFDAVFASVDKGTLQLPLQSNGYLYQVLSRKADKAEGAQEAEREVERRVVPQRDTVQVKGKTMAIGDALQAVLGGKDPALADIEARSRQAAPIPADVRARMAALRKGGPA